MRSAVASSIVPGLMRRIGSGGKNSFGAMINQGFVVASGLATFAVLGTRLGTAGFGVYAATLALVHLLGPIAEVGVNHLSIKTWARTSNVALAWSQNVGTHIVGGSMLAVLLWIIQPWIIPGIDRLTIAILAFSEVGILGTTAGAVMLAEGMGRAYVGTRVRMATAVVRLAALAAFVLIGSPTIATWAQIQLVAAFISLAMSWLILIEVTGRGTRPRLIERSDVGQGLSFGLNQLMAGAQKDLDKVVLAFYGQNVAAGIYAAGYRIVTLTGLPLTGLIGGTYGRFFVAGERSLGEVRQLAIRTTRVAVLVTIPVALAIVVAAPLVPAVMGDKYDGTENVIRLLAFLPAVKALQTFAANALTGADLHRVRVGLMLFVTLLNGALNVVVIPRYSWQGAVLTTWISEIVLAAGLWMLLSHHARLESNRAEHPPLT